MEIDRPMERSLYFAINQPQGSSVSQSDMTNMANESQDFIAGVYPVSDTLNNFTSSFAPPFIDGGLNDAYCWAWRVITGAERCVAVVTRDWFVAHSPTSNGVFYPNLPNITDVQNGGFNITAHELGHSYGLVPGASIICDSGQPTNLSPHTRNLIASGYWFDFSTDVNPDEGPNTLDYMNCSNSANDPYPDSRTAAQNIQRWSSTDDFAWLFSKFSGFRQDPEILLVEGTIGRNNNVQLGPSYRSLTGTADLSRHGDGAILVKDHAGNVVAQLTFPVVFTALDSTVVFDPAPFGFSVPYPPNATTVEFVRSGQVLARFSPTTKLLADAVLSIPDSGFDQNSAERRNALLNKIGALDGQLAAGDLVGARNNLQNDIEKHLDDWLVDGYATETPLQYTKPQIVALVNELIQRLGG